MMNRKLQCCSSEETRKIVRKSWIIDTEGKLFECCRCGRVIDGEWVIPVRTEAYDKNLKGVTDGIRFLCPGCNCEHL